MKKSIFGLAILLMLIYVNVAKGEEMIAKGKTVKFDYTLTVEEKVVDSSLGKEPLEYVQGSNMIIPGLEKQMEGLKVGDERTFTIKPEEAYGMIDQRMVVEIPKSKITTKDFAPEKGMVIQMQTQNGPMPGMIQEVKADSLMVDFNHPLAGQTLTFKIKVIDIK